MTMTGDWTMVKEGSESEPSTSPAPSCSPKKPTGNTNKAFRFPCLEQPTRVILYCNGYYLWGCRNGKLIARKRRSEKDEWTIEGILTEDFANNNINHNRSPTNNKQKDDSIVFLRNHKFGGKLSVVDLHKPTKDGKTQIPMCIKDGQKSDNKDENPNDLGLTPTHSEEINFFDEQGQEQQQEQLPDDEDEDIDDYAPSNTNALQLETINEEDQQWCLVKNNGVVMIESLKTGDFLAITDEGRVVLVPKTSSSTSSSIQGISWEVECVTGELCFLSNPTLDARVRCDMAGLLTVSPNWKGWEVLRFMETNEDGYVKISSWMHSQWFLCSDAQGNVSACSHSESLHEDSAREEMNGSTSRDQDGKSRCSKWAIERYPRLEGESDTGGSRYDGVIIRSKTHGRLLSIREGILRTYDSLDTICASANGDTSASNVPPSQENENVADIVKRKSADWWKNSMKQVQKKMSDSAIQRRNSKNPVDLIKSSMTKSGREEQKALSSSMAAVPEGETIVWQLEAAHLQTYYFLSPSTFAMDEADASSTNNAISIGTFPNVTENLRSSDKIQLVRNDDNVDTLQLYLIEKDSYIGCSSDGSIFLAPNAETDETEWNMESKENGTIFQSKLYGLYLSFKEEMESIATDQTNETLAEAGGNSNDADTIEGSSSSINDTDMKGKNTSGTSPSKLKTAFEKLLPNKKRVCTVLHGSPSYNLWNLEPCTPRAVSSEKLKTFAIGTSIAVGTTIAMPFALAGVAAIMGAVGAEAGIGFGIVAAGLTGAEAIASVGAIGATAYICFRPEKNSLTDEHMNDEDSLVKKPWSKRPFSNWRNW